MGSHQPLIRRWSGGLYASGREPSRRTKRSQVSVVYSDGCTRALVGHECLDHQHQNRAIEEFDAIERKRLGSRLVAGWKDPGVLLRFGRRCPPLDLGSPEAFVAPPQSAGRQ